MQTDGKKVELIKNEKDGKKHFEAINCKKET